MSDLDLVLALAADLDNATLELARGYTRLEHGKLEQVGGYQGRKAMSAGVAELYQQRGRERGELAHRISGVLAANHLAPNFEQVAGNLSAARNLIAQHDQMSEHAGVRGALARATAAVQKKDRAGFVSAHNELERHVKRFTVMHAPAE